jgi:hypothetical protein
MQIVSVSLKLSLVHELCCLARTWEFSHILSLAMRDFILRNRQVTQFVVVAKIFLYSTKVHLTPSSMLHTLESENDNRQANREPTSIPKHMRGKLNESKLPHELTKGWKTKKMFPGTLNPCQAGQDLSIQSTTASLLCVVPSQSIKHKYCSPAVHEIDCCSWWDMQYVC